MFLKVINKTIKSSKHRIAILATAPITIKAFYKDQFEALNQAGIDTTVICASDTELNEFLPKETGFMPVDFTRVLNPIKDLKVLCKLFLIFRREKFDIVQYSTLKAALLGSIASFFARTPLRIYMLWGLYYEGQTDLIKSAFRFFEKIICLLSTHILPNSHEMADVIVQQGLTRKAKCQVLLNGSVCGVDLEQYNPAKWQNSRERIRGEFNIPESGIVIGVFGRLTGDKGVNEIVSAFEKFSRELDNTFLLVAGRQEDKDRLLPETERILNSHPKIFILGWQRSLLPCFAAIDIFCLPSYREGFPQALLEAQAMGKPVICTNIQGCREAITDGQTGFLVEPKSSEALIKPLRKLIIDPQLRKSMGWEGRKRVGLMFNRKDFIRAMVEHRLKLLSRVERLSR